MKTAIYVRSALENDFSCETQIVVCKGFLKPNDEYVIYSDNGYSAHSKNRPAFKQMVKDIEDGKIDKVIVQRLDRIGRSLVSINDFQNFLDKYNATFVSITEKFDTSTSLGEDKKVILNCLAELDAENKTKSKKRCC